VNGDPKRRVLAALAVLVVFRMAFHAVYLPAFEGPDEPQHLARAWDYARLPPGEAFAGRQVSGAIVASLGAYPCRQALHVTLGCPVYGSAAAGGSGAFDLLRAAPPTSPAAPASNVEGNQPPLFYALAGWLLRPFGPTVPAALLFLRLLSVGFVAAALFGPLRSVSREWSPELSAAGLLALLLPGASEGLARASNEAAIFFWTALVLAALFRRLGLVPLALLMAAGPLIKPTAFPVVVFAVGVAISERRMRAAVAGAAASLLVFPVQALRGWMWGGTLELNFPGAAIGEPAARAVLGFARSAYAFVKTTFWVGGFSLLRPPRWLTLLYFGWLGLFAWSVRRRSRPPRLAAHAAGLFAAAAGFTVFAIANRRYYGDWGGVGGWYAWGWSPWIVQAVSDLGAVRRRAGAVLLGSEALVVLAANAVWMSATLRLFG
jgi:hypothetical protein